MFQDKIFANPLHQVILEAPLDHLVKEIRSNELMYVRTREIVCKELYLVSFNPVTRLT